MYELHIAIPVLPETLLKTIFTELSAVGIAKSKYFYAVKNIRPDDANCHPAGTPPTGHDLDNPRAMSTVKVTTYEEARKILLDGMAVLAYHGVHGNFEIEGLLGHAVPNYPSIDIEREFPGFKRVHDAPAFENHIIWKGPQRELPSCEEIVKYFEVEIGTTPHQIVDFGRDEHPTDETIVSRVATVYQSSRQAVLDFNTRLEKAHTTLGYRYFVGEQVILVGEAKKTS